MIIEGINREYRDSPYGHYKYEIVKGNTYYRQFERDGDSGWGTASPSNGMLVNLYTIKKYGSDGKLQWEETTIYGFKDIILDENGQANVAQISEYTDNYDGTYSLESVEKMMKGYGYELVEK